MAGPANTDAVDAEYSTQVCDVRAELLLYIMCRCVYMERIDNEGEWQWFQRMEDWQMNMAARHVGSPHLHAFP
jgi:hypothetical protein